MSGIECTVCLQPFCNPVTLSGCRHLLCMSCVHAVWGRSPTPSLRCPVCTQLSDAVYPPNHNRVVRELCIERMAHDERQRCNTEWSRFASKYELFQRSRRWKPLDGTTIVPLRRWIAIHQLAPLTVQRMRGLETRIEDSKRTAADHRRLAKQADAAAHNAKHEVQKIAATIP